jgi:threonine synthase
MFLSHLKCSGCGSQYSADEPRGLCPKCTKPLLAQYDLEAVSGRLRRDALADRPNSMWRYRELLPVSDTSAIVTLGEGMTPLIPMRRAGEKKGLRQLFVKDESVNPTHTFKARGMSTAVSMMKQFGVRKLAVPTAGNAGHALAAYAASAGLEAYVIMPKDSPRSNIVGCRMMGAKVDLVDGSISDCATELERRSTAEGWFNIATLKEPYRVEGKKTMGFEIMEQLGWRPPSAIVYPAGGGSGLIGIWKAIMELIELKWIPPCPPKMYAVQCQCCAPVVRRFAGAESLSPGLSAPMRSSGLKVPNPIGMDLMLEVLRKSGGSAIAVTEEEITRAMEEIGGCEGVFASPEGAATFAALGQLAAEERLAPDDTVVLLNTGSGLKYLEWFD